VFEGRATTEGAAFRRRAGLELWPGERRPPAARLRRAFLVSDADTGLAIAGAVARSRFNR